MKANSPFHTQPIHAQSIHEQSAVIQVEHLKCHFDVSGSWLARMISRTGRILVKAVDDVSFTIEKGEIFSLVGESGSGKSTIGRLILGLETATAGQPRPLPTSSTMATSNTPKKTGTIRRVVSLTSVSWVAELSQAGMRVR